VKVGGRFLKRISTQKVNPIAAVAVDDCTMVGSTKPIPPEVNRRARTSAAMIGLAISMGASSVLLARQGDGAIAAEPAANTVPTVTSATTEEAGPQEVKSATAAVEVFTPNPLEHKVQESLPTAEVSNSKAAEAALSLPQKTSNIETANSRSTEEPENEVAVDEKEQAVVPETPTTELNEGESATATSKVNELLKAKQAVALNSLKESSNRLRSSLAEWKSEESFNSSSIRVSEPSAPTVVSPQLQPLVQQFVAAEPVSPQWKPQVATVKPATTAKSQTQQPAVPTIASAAQVADPAISVVYQVKSGDTIGAIARNYGMDVTTIAKINHLDNPNQIQVSQQLKIPQSGTANLATGTTLTASFGPNLPVVTALVPQEIGKTARTKVTAAAFPLSATGTDDTPEINLPELPPAGQKIEATQGNKFLSASKSPNNDFSSAAAMKNQTLLADNSVNPEQPNRNKQYSNPYVERLRAEILQLRQNHRPQLGGYNYSNNYPNNYPNNYYPTPQPAAPAINSAAQLRTRNSYAAPVNPSFRPNQYNQALQAEIQRRAEEAPDNPPRPSYRIAVPVPLPRKQSVATAPLGVDPYQPYNQNEPGRTVSPESPSLENPYNYPPNLNQQFQGYNWPAKGVFTSGYGWRWGRMHRGVDIAAPTGTPVSAAAPGVVVYARWNSGGYGNLVQIRHPDGSLTRYAHNSRLLVQEGQVVEQGQQIAAMGTTGHSTGPHCHFEIHPPGQGAVNPIAFLPPRS